MSTDLRWVPSTFVRRSPIAPDVWVPFDVPDSPEHVAQHAGPIEDVKPWVEQHVREEYDRFRLPQPRMRWTQPDPTLHVLQVADAPEGEE